MNPRRPYDVALLDVPATRGASRAADPRTSVDAARSMSGQVLRDQQALVLRGLGHIDCTAYEVWLRLQDDPARPKENVISKRLGELVAAGMLEPTGRTRPGSSHREQKVYAITQRGREFLRDRSAA